MKPTDTARTIKRPPLARLDIALGLLEYRLDLNTAIVAGFRRGIQWTGKPLDPEKARTLAIRHVVSLVETNLYARCTPNNLSWHWDRYQRRNIANAIVASVDWTSVRDNVSAECFSAVESSFWKIVRWAPDFSDLPDDPRLLPFWFAEFEVANRRPISSISIRRIERKMMACTVVAHAVFDDMPGR